MSHQIGLYSQEEGELPPKSSICRRITIICIMGINGNKSG
jgi:hypothetical protein